MRRPQVRVALVGPRGAGKTTVGRLVAERLGVPFWDSDRLVEEQAGRSISEIFAQWGEAAFRRLERQAIERVCGWRRFGVLATGGGAVVDPQVRKLLRSWGHVVLLSAPASVLADRIRDTDRPSLSGRPIDEELGDLLEERHEAYGAAAHVVVDASRPVQEVVQAVIQVCIERSG